MSNAHKGSKLILKDSLIPVDYSSTYLDFNNNTTGIQYGQLIQPIGSPVSTIRPYEGKFGGGIAVEQGTSNIALIADSRWALNKSNYNGTYTVTTTTSGFDTSCRFDFAPRVDPSGSGWQVASYTHGITTWSTGNAYTWSTYGRRLTNDTVSVRLLDGNGTNQQGSSVNFTGNIGEWTRISNTWTPTITSGGTTFYVSSAETASFELANIQIEQKTFATSYVNGTRANGNLNYDKGIFDLGEGSATFWFNSLSNIPDQFTSLFTIGNYSSPVTQDWFSLYHGSGWASGNSVTLQIANGSTAQSIGVTINPTFQPYKWYFVSARWSKSTNKVTLTMFLDDGTKLENTTTYGATIPTLNSFTAFQIGQVWNNGNSFINGLFSDFIIDRRYITDDEMIARFISNKPVYNPYDYRAIAY